VRGLRDNFQKTAKDLVRAAENLRVGTPVPIGEASHRTPKMARRDTDVAAVIKKEIQDTCL
jgi:hypothetical protein